MLTRLRTPWVLTAATVLAACHSVAPVSPVHQTLKTTASATPTPSPALTLATVSPKPVVTGTARPAASATPGATATPAIATLLPPTTAFNALSGTVIVDPTYLVAAGSATLLSNNGGSVVALGDAGIISDQGGCVIASTQGGSAIADPSGAFLSAGNAGILSNNGSGIISNNSSGIISNHAGGYHLQATAATPSLLPAAGLAVSAVSLSTHQYVPVGQDAAGHAVYTVYSDAQGGYKLYVPATVQDNIVVVANVPRTQDRRLVFNAITPAKGTAVPVGDDASNGTKLARTILAGQLAEIMTSADVAATVLAITSTNDSLPQASRAVIAKLVTVFSQAAQAHHVPTTPNAVDLPEVQELATLLADQLLAALPYDTMRLGAPFNASWPGSNEQVYDALDGAMGVLRETTGRYLAAKLAAGGSLPITLSFPSQVEQGAAENSCTFTDSLSLKEPADTSAYLVNDVLSRTQGHGIANTQSLFAALATADTPGVTDLNQIKPGDPEYYLDPVSKVSIPASLRLQAALDVLLGYFALELEPPGQADDAPPTALLTSLLTTVATYGDAHTFGGTPSPPLRLGTGIPCVPSVDPPATGTP